MALITVSHKTSERQFILMMSAIGVGISSLRRKCWGHNLLGNTKDRPMDKIRHPVCPYLPA